MKIETASFPEIKATSLAGKTYRLPGDFEGEINLLFVAFQRWHQDWVDTWLPLAKQLVATHEGLNFYELPTIRRMNPIYRWSLDAGMRAGIPDQQAHATTITLYLDKARFRAALDLPGEETIYLLLVDRSGRVLWRGEGPRTDEVAAALQSAIKTALDSDQA